MDDYEPWLTPCDPDFDPEKCESAYALWAVKEEGEPVKFLEANITDNLDYPSGYWFFWRTISFSEETGRLIEGEWGGAGDICRADYVADMCSPAAPSSLGSRANSTTVFHSIGRYAAPWTIARRRGRPRRSAPGSWRCP